MMRKYTFDVTVADGQTVGTKQIGGLNGLIRYIVVDHVTYGVNYTLSIVDEGGVNASGTAFWTGPSTTGTAGRDLFMPIASTAPDWAAADFVPISSGGDDANFHPPGSDAGGGMPTSVIKITAASAVTGAKLATVELMVQE